jgi:cytidine deaminase
MSALMELSDGELITRANLCRKSLQHSPEQSLFRVIALFIVQTGDGTQEPILVEGTNAEQGYIGGAICAERAALCKLRFLNSPKILKVVIATDSNVPISPGALCREYLSSHAPSATPVVIGNNNGSIIVRCMLGDLQPFPYLYRFQDRKNVEEFSTQFCTSMVKCESMGNDDVVSLHALAMSVIRTSTLHPITYAAAVLFQDGTRQAARFLPGNEYGCSLDPVSQLVRDMDRKQLEAETVEEMELSKPDWIIQVDQFGVCHAPFAMARSLLTEYDFGSTRFVYHDAAGRCAVGLSDALLPLPPSLDKLTHDHFLSFEEMHAKHAEE